MLMIVNSCTVCGTIVDTSNVAKWVTTNGKRCEKDMAGRVWCKSCIEILVEGSEIYEPTNE